MELIVLAVVIASVIYFMRKRKKAKDVPAGLQCFDQNGNLCFDANSNTTRIIGTVNTGTKNGSIHVPEFATKKGWVAINYIVTDTSNFGPLSMSSLPQVSIEGQYVKWVFNGFGIDATYWAYLQTLGASQHNLSVNLIYGIYL